MKKIMLSPVLAALTAVLAACSGGSDGAPTSRTDVRTIQIRTLDSLAYSPSRITVRTGETVRFVVTNPGTTTHEFVVGGEDLQMDHEDEMGMSMDHGAMAGGLPALTLEPGQTKTANVTFDEAGRLMYGCHVAGHYEGGMVGTIDVT